MKEIQDAADAHLSKLLSEPPFTWVIDDDPYEVSVTAGATTNTGQILFWQADVTARLRARR
jgi:hypothetical protein